MKLIFARGAFDETAVLLTSGALRGIAMGLWATTLGMILLRFLNNAGRNGHAALILAAAYAANGLLNLLAWRIIGPSGNGSILIGLGEATRGLVLVAGTAFALSSVRPLMRLLLLCGCAGGSYGRAVHPHPASLDWALDAPGAWWICLPWNNFADRDAADTQGSRGLGRRARRGARMNSLKWMEQIP